MTSDELGYIQELLVDMQGNAIELFVIWSFQPIHSLAYSRKEGLHITHYALYITVHCITLCITYTVLHIIITVRCISSVLEIVMNAKIYVVNFLNKKTAQQ